MKDFFLAQVTILRTVQRTSPKKAPCVLSLIVQCPTMCRLSLLSPPWASQPQPAIQVLQFWIGLALIVNAILLPHDSISWDHVEFIWSWWLQNFNIIRISKCAHKSVRVDGGYPGKEEEVVPQKLRTKGLVHDFQLKTDAQGWNILDLFFPFLTFCICYETQLTNTNIRMNKTGQLSFRAPKFASPFRVHLIY